MQVLGHLSCSEDVAQAFLDLGPALCLPGCLIPPCAECGPEPGGLHVLKAHGQHSTLISQFNSIAVPALKG